jgi:hypothetical protein
MRFASLRFAARRRIMRQIAIEEANFAPPSQTILLTLHPPKALMLRSVLLRA